MHRELIERYIQFALNNDFKINELAKSRYGIDYSDGINFVYYNSMVDYKINLTELITSGPFIEAIAKGLYISDNLLKDETIDNIILESNIQSVTIEQAFAIRDNNLDEFIQDLLPKN